MQEEPQARFRNTRSRFFKANVNPFEQHEEHAFSANHRQQKKYTRQSSNPTTSNSSQQKTGTFWKEKGNEAFKSREYEIAIKHYSKAIQMNPSESVFYSNRARCYIILKDWQKALKDAQEAVELDENNAKAHYMCGTTLGEISRQTQDYKKAGLALKKLTRALTLSRSQKKHIMEEQIQLSIFRMKKIAWYIKYQHEETAKKQAVEVLAHQTKSKAELNQTIQIILNSSRQNFYIPDYLCCKITMEIMENPVVTDAGITYERQAIEDHFSKNGCKDPFTNKPVSNKLIANLSLKQAIENFLQDNPWAFEYSVGERLDSLVL